MKYCKIKMEDDIGPYSNCFMCGGGARREDQDGDEEDEKTIVVFNDGRLQHLFQV